MRLLLASLALLATLTTAAAVPLQINDVELAVDPNAQDTEMDNRYVVRTLQIEPSRSMLVLIDTWDNHPNDGWAARARKNIEEHLGPALDAARKAGMLIVYAPTGRAIHERLAPHPDERIIDSTDGVDDAVELQQLIKEHGITTVFYAGYATNICMTTKPASMANLVRLDPGLQYVLLQDATIAYEMPDTLGHEMLRKAFTIFAMMLGHENIGAATNAQFFTALAAPRP